MLHKKMEEGLAALPAMVKLSFPAPLRAALLDQAAALDLAMDRIQTQAQEIDSLRNQLATLSNKNERNTP